MNTYTLSIGAKMATTNWDAPSAQLFCETLLQLMSLKGTSTTLYGFDSEIPANGLAARMIHIATEQRLPSKLDVTSGAVKLFGKAGAQCCALHADSIDDRMSVASQPIVQPIGEAGDLCVVVSAVDVSSTLNNVVTLAPLDFIGSSVQVCVGILRESAQDGIYDDPFAGFIGHANARNFANKFVTPGASSVARVDPRTTVRGISGPPERTLRDAAGNTLMRLQ